jgi:hypothetical protein
VRPIMGLLCLILAGGPAFSQSKDVAYYCVGDAAGGLWYNEKTKKWEGASFRAEQKFVLKMNFAGARIQKGMIEEQVSDYKVMVTASGQDTGLPCTRNYPNETVTVADQYRSFSCTTGAHDYMFNLRTNRFLSIYVHGYVGGKDSNADTPHVEGGTCTKID